MKKVSVIVPIYNVEKFIERCVRSLMEQTLKEIEYIFVNDATSDRSMEILYRVIKDYPQRKDSIYIINHKTNKGVASVRNTGLKIAKGEYIIYCDSDDWVDVDMYKKMYNKAKESNADIVTVDFYHEYLYSSKLQKQVCVENNIKCISDMLIGNLYCVIWNKLIKRELYIQNNIFFPDGINMWEDVLTVILLYYKASSIVYLPSAFYHYIHLNTNSYTKKITKSSLFNMIEVVKKLEHFFCEEKIYSLLSDLCYMKLTVKLNLLLNSDGHQQYVWNNLYPESNSYIFSYINMSYFWRIALKFASMKMLPIFNFMKFISKIR